MRNSEKTYLKENVKEKVCPEKRKRHAKKKKRHTGESMQRKKYALRGKKACEKEKGHTRESKQGKKYVPGSETGKKKGAHPN